MILVTEISLSTNRHHPPPSHTPQTSRDRAGPPGHVAVVEISQNGRAKANFLQKNTYLTIFIFILRSQQAFARPVSIS